MSQSVKEFWEHRVGMVLTGDEGIYRRALAVIDYAVAGSASANEARSAAGWALESWCYAECVEALEPGLQRDLFTMLFPLGFVWELIAERVVDEGFFDQFDVVDVDLLDVEVLS